MDTVVVVGDLTVLHCQPPDSVPTPSVTWKKEGLELLPSLDSRLTVMPSGNLYITNTTLEDAGSYQCEATNPVSGAKRRSQQALLTVIAPGMCICGGVHFMNLYLRCANLVDIPYAAVSDYL